MQVFLRHENEATGRYFCEAEPTDFAMSCLIEFLRKAGGVYCPDRGGEILIDASYQIVLDHEVGAYAEIVLHPPEKDAPPA